MTKNIKSPYITYFQSTTTLGILSHADSLEEATKLAKTKLNNSDGVNHCFYDQTNFHAVETELAPVNSLETEGVKFVFDPSDEMKNVIATRLHKNVEDLVTDDYAEFIDDSICRSRLEDV